MKVQAQMLKWCPTDISFHGVYAKRQHRMHHCLRLRKHQSIHHLNILRKTGVCTNSVQSVLCPLLPLAPGCVSSIITVSFLLLGYGTRGKEQREITIAKQWLFRNLLILICFCASHYHYLILQLRSDIWWKRPESHCSGCWMCQNSAVLWPHKAGPVPELLENNAIRKFVIEVTRCKGQQCSSPTHAWLGDSWPSKCPLIPAPISSSQPMVRDSGSCSSAMSAHKIQAPNGFLTSAKQACTFWSLLFCTSVLKDSGGLSHISCGLHANNQARLVWNIKVNI